MSDELLRRLRRADPVPSDVDVDPMGSERFHALMEEIMISTSKSEAQPRPARPLAQRRRRQTLAVAAAATVVLGALAIANLDRGGPQEAPLALSVAADDGMAMCIPFDVGYLSEMSVAFGGTVTSATDETVVIEVDRWFKGGNSSIVEVTAPMAGTSILLDGVDFEPGSRYLITATDGVINVCGFSGEATPELEAAFTEAFPAS